MTDWESGAGENWEVVAESLQFTISEEQISIAREFRQRLLDSGEENDVETTTLRYLIARNFDQVVAFDLYRRGLAWRDEYQPHKITREDVDAELKLEKSYWHGVDKRGCPIFIFRLARHLVAERDLELSLRTVLYRIEQGLSRISGTNVKQLVVILDRQDTSRANSDVDLLKRLAQIMGDFYPERLAHLYVLHPNWIFTFVMTVVRPFLGPRTQAKISVLKPDDIRAAFDVAIDADQRQPRYFGSSSFEYSYAQEIADERHTEDAALATTSAVASQAAPPSIETATAPASSSLQHSQYEIYVPEMPLSEYDSYSSYDDDGYSYYSEYSDDEIESTPDGIEAQLRAEEERAQAIGKRRDAARTSLETGKAQLQTERTKQATLLQTLTTARQAVRPKKSGCCCR